MNVILVDPTTPEGEQAVRQHAARLLDGEGGRDIALAERPDFFFAASDFFSRGARTIRYALLSGSDGPIAMMPVEIGAEQNLPGLYFSIYRHPSRLSGTGVICPQEHLDAAVAAVVETLRAEWSKVAGFALAGLDTEGPLLAAITRHLAGSPRLEREAKLQLYIDLSDFDTIDAYYDSRSRHYKKNYRSGRNRLQKMGDYAFTQTGPEGRWRFEDVDRVDEKTWRARESEGDIPKLLVDFCRKLDAVADRAEDSQLCALTLDGRPISMYYSLVQSGVKYVFKNTFDPDFAHVSPSVVAFHHVVESALDQGLDRIELMAGNAYARPWANRERFLSDDVVFFNSLKGRAAHLASTSAQKLREIARTPSAREPNGGPGKVSS